ncbi:MAG: hypothetical protein JSR65_01740 [Proteobacteria bacterium]|nr:hypothetical protein [Pseudomonadota bacterium]
MLRHVIARLRHQDWTAVVVEPIDVVIGVFLGVLALRELVMRLSTAHAQPALCPSASRQMPQS